MSELKPCAFCGSTPIAETDADDLEVYVFCDTDGCPAGESPISVTVKKWNTRHIPEGHTLVPNEFLAEYLELLELSDWRPIYKLTVSNQVKAMIKAAGGE